jgi:hypothetical protein
MATQETFRSLEHRGWSERANIYDDYTARFCRQGIGPLLELRERLAAFARDGIVHMPFPARVFSAALA